MAKNFIYMKKMSNWFRVILYNLAILLMVFGGSELYIGYVLNNPASCPKWLYSKLRKYHEDFDRQIIQYLPECAHYDSTLFYKLNPGEFVYSSREFSNRFHINSRGFRDDESSLDHPQIVVLGDSYAMGWGVDQEETFPQVLERNTGMKVLNTGVSSYGTVREMISFEQVNTDSLEYLVIQYCPNDDYENQFYFRRDSQFVPSSEARYNVAVQNHIKSKRYFPFKHIYRLIPMFRSKKVAEQSTNVIPKQKKRISPAVAFIEVIKACDKIPPGIQIIIFSLEAERCTNHFVKRVRNQLNKSYSEDSIYDRISFVDLTGQIDSSHRFILDPHLNAIGHEVVAEALFKHINKLSIEGGL